jgi:hypothetical protein
MTKILVVGSDLDILALLRKRLPDYEFLAVHGNGLDEVTINKKEVLMIDNFPESWARQLSHDDMESMILHEMLLLENHRQFYPIKTINASERYYHAYTKPYGKKHRQRF